MKSTSLSGITTYSYDHAGNRRTVAAPSGDVTTYTWNGQNQLIQVELPSEDVVTYVWAPVNKNSEERIAQRDDGVDIQQWLWDNNNVLRETDDLGSVQAEYTYQPQPYGDLVSDRRASESNFYRFDALGSTTGLTDNAGNSTDEYRYTAFGQEFPGTGTTDTPYRWVGQQGYRQDDATGLANLRARDYDSRTGQFVSQDPIGLSGGDSNFYRYVANSPTNQVDPSGLAIDSVSASFWKAIAAGNLSEALAIFTIHGATIAPQGSVTATSALLSLIYQRYPASAQMCTTSAIRCSEVFRAVGQSPTVIRIYDRLGARVFFLKDGTTRFGSEGFHEAVYCNGRIYDALTGPAGMTHLEYVIMLEKLKILPVIPALQNLPRQ